MNLFKKISRRTLLLFIFVLMLFFLIVILYFNFKGTVQNDSLSPALNATDFGEQAIIEPGLPVRIKIPNITIDVALESVGLTSDGSLDTPRSTDEVGWFELGKRPGEIGSAVIVGHYGLKNGKPSAFENLRKLTKGDEIYIEDDSGLIIAFVVREIRVYDPKADALEVFSSNDEKSHLNLITCEGSWNNDAKSFSKRLVVFTDKE